MSLPKEFDDLQLQWKLGESDGVVRYRAKDTKTGADVVVELGGPAHPEGLDHPNILRVLRDGSVEGQRYVVRELVEGESFHALLTSGRLSERRAISLLVDVARALAFARDKGHPHPALTQESILVDGKDTPKLTGFVPDAQSDPKDEVLVFGKVLKHVLHKESSPALRSISKRCLAADPELRYASVAEVAVDLKRYQEGEPLQRSSGGGVKKLLVPAGMVGGLLLIGILLFAVFGEREEKKSGEGDSKAENEVDQAAELVTRARRILADRSREGEALQLLDQSIALKPSAGAYGVRGQLHARYGRYDKAGDDLEHARVLKPESVLVRELEKRLEARKLLGNAVQQDNALAIETLTRAIDLYRHDADLFLQRGRCYGRQKEYARAISDLSQAAYLNKELTEARLLTEVFRAKLSEQNLPRTKKPPMNVGEIGELRGEVLNAWDEEDWKRLEALLRDGLERGPAQRWMYLHLGRAYLRLGKTEQARDTIAQAVQGDDVEKEAWLIRGDIHLELGEAGVALESYREGAPTTREINQLIKEYRDALKIRSGNPLVHLKRGAFYHVKRNYEPAISDFTAAIEGGDARGYYWRAMAHREEGRGAKAAEDLRAFVKEMPLASARKLLEEITK